MSTFDLALATPGASSTNRIAAGSWTASTGLDHGHGHGRRVHGTFRFKVGLVSLERWCTDTGHGDRQQGFVHRRVNW